MFKLVAAAALLCCATAAFTQKDFIISFWVDPLVPAAAFPSAYATVAAGNFTALLGGFGACLPLLARRLEMRW